eukprot:SAG31_NODE_7052_length_1803_cov_1.148474_1_plen_107_part_00
MRADDAQQLLMRRVRWAYTRDDQGRKWPRVNDKRQDKRGHGPNSGRLTKTAEKARTAMIKRDAATLSPLRLQARSADELLPLSAVYWGTAYCSTGPNMSQYSFMER